MYYASCRYVGTFLCQKPSYEKTQTCQFHSHHVIHRNQIWIQTGGACSWNSALFFHRLCGPAKLLKRYIGYIQSFWKIFETTGFVQEWGQWKLFSYILHHQFRPLLQQILCIERSCAKTLRSVLLEFRLGYLANVLSVDCKDHDQIKVCCVFAKISSFPFHTIPIANSNLS